MTKEDLGKHIASKADLLADNEALIRELKRVQKDLYEAIETQQINAWKIQQEAFRGVKYAQEENKRLREALELIARSRFYFTTGEEAQQLRNVCEIAEDALKDRDK